MGLCLGASGCPQGKRRGWYRGSAVTELYQGKLVAYGYQPQPRLSVALGEKVASWKDAPGGTLFSSARVSFPGGWLTAES